MQLCVIEVHALLLGRHHATGVFRQRSEWRLVVPYTGAAGKNKGEAECEQGGSQWAHGL
ncbi:hypothetical protein GCM10007898_17170 [Dyella flagellata]|uniref:Uncharacterized protein n=1 Tax=Dyella flagellata TaxID=1867833 RepID=A0ABQ5XAQ5_9GAMM|nr:hypothetical protein GCM10007898_17170 [Dyella flagellata]